MARPSKYETDVQPKLMLVEAWARNGLTLEQIAKNLGIAPSTLSDYRNKFSELSETLKRGKEVVDVEVENALYKRAVGYAYDEVTYETRPGPDGELTRVEVKRVTKEVQPDVTAQIFWLKNRKPDEWRDRQQIDHNVNMTIEDALDAIEDG